MSASAFFSSALSQEASAGLSFISFHQKKAHKMAGIPSQINIQRQPSARIKYPEIIDIQRMVTGFPNISIVLALDLSSRVNQRLINTIMEGKTALSKTPSINRMTSKIVTLLRKPVAIANNPQRISDQNINFFALLL